MIRKNLALAIGLVGILGLITSCATLRTYNDYDPETDFSDYETFAWISDQPLIRPKGRDDQYVSPLNLQRIKNAIESELSAKGFHQVGDHAAADFVVSFTATPREKIYVESYPVPYQGPYHGSWAHQWPYYSDAVAVHTYTEGTLAIDIFDRELQQPVWHGVAKKRIAESDRKNAGRLIQEAVAAILGSFPPG